MAIVKIKYGRRSFIKTTALTGGGLMIGFSWLASCSSGSEEAQALQLPDEWFEINSFLKIGENGVVTIMSPNPEFGQGVKTSMPMIVAEELDVDWQKVIVEQAPFNTDLYTRQFAGGSQAIRSGWQGLRMAGATAKDMLKQAAAVAWGVSAQEITAEKGVLYHSASGNEAHYGEFASAAAQMPVPEQVELKNPDDFNIVGTSQKNVDGKDIVTGKPLFGLDIEREGMLYATVVFPPAFGMKLKSFNDSNARLMPGIKDIFSIKTFEDDYKRNFFDVNAFTDLIAIVGNSTWEVMQAKKTLNVEWEAFSDSQYVAAGWGGGEQIVDVPDGLESTADHKQKMREESSKPARVARRDGNPEAAFSGATKVIERTYTAPYLGHFMMEPINFFADVTDDKVVVVGPTQAPEFVEQTLSARLGIPESPLSANRFPAGAVDNYLAESWSVSSNISVGAFRAPGSNFIGPAEQMFLDEVAEAAGKDPIQFRLDLLKRAQENPVGERNDYDAARYAGVLELVRDKSGWGNETSTLNRGVAAYFCHNSYVAHVLDVEMQNGQPRVGKVTSAVDCGIVVNQDAAANMVEGAVVDGIGNAMYGEMTFSNGEPDKDNFGAYRMIRHNEAPKSIEVHFVPNQISPTGLGEPPFPPVFAALGNALYKATGDRYYHQPFIKNSFS